MSGWHWLYIPAAIVGWEIGKRVLAKVTGFDAWSQGR